MKRQIHDISTVTDQNEQIQTLVKGYKNAAGEFEGGLGASQEAEVDPAEYASLLEFIGVDGNVLG